MFILVPAHLGSPGQNLESCKAVCSDPQGLSVNKAHNVVVAWSGANKVGLLEYTTHSTLVREISLQNALSEPCHAVQLSAGDYVVSQDTSPGEVSVVGADGQVVCCYHPPHSSDLEQIQGVWLW